MKHTICVTKRAGRHLKEMLETRAKSPDERLRLVPAPGAQVALVLDKARDEDEVIEVGGVPTLVIDPSAASVLEGAIIDYPEVSGETTLVVIK